MGRERKGVMNFHNIHRTCDSVRGDQEHPNHKYKIRCVCVCVCFCVCIYVHTTPLSQRAYKVNEMIEFLASFELIVKVKSNSHMFDANKYIHKQSLDVKEHCVHIVYTLIK